ncbi:MAG: hypothetical protein ACRCSN_08485 [Dermatophilaceae bacterium]
MALQNAFGDIALAAKQDEQTALLGRIPAQVGGRLPVDSAPVAVRRDADTASVVDGAAHALNTDQAGRLKVAVQPGDIAPVVGTITSATSTVVADVSRASNVVIDVDGTFAGVNFTFEGQVPGGLTWKTLQAVRSNANTIETASGVLGASPAYSWELSVNGYTSVRVRATAWTSGTATVRIQPGAYATEPIPAAQTHAVTGSGNFNVVPVAGTAYALTTAATTNLVVPRNAAASLYELTVFNPSAAVVFVKLYNKTTAPVLATDVPLVVLPVAAGALGSFAFGFTGKRFSTGVAMAVTGAAPNTDATAVAAGILISATYL